MHFSQKIKMGLNTVWKQTLQFSNLPHPYSSICKLAVAKLEVGKLPTLGKFWGKFLDEENLRDSILANCPSFGGTSLFLLKLNVVKLCDFSGCPSLQISLHSYV